MKNNHCVYHLYFLSIHLFFDTLYIDNCLNVFNYYYYYYCYYYYKYYE